MVNGRSLSATQTRLVSREIRRESRLKRQALTKRRRGVKLTEDEKRRIQRSREQIVRIGFEKARQQDPSIPDVQERRVR